MTRNSLANVDLPLGLFFDQATRAVVASQRKLDSEINPRTLGAPNPGQRLFYALPRATFEIESAMVVDRKRVRFTRRGERQTLRHRLGFQLIAVPEPPPEFAAEPRVELEEPAFLPTTAQERGLFASLIQDLEADDGWQLVDQATTHRVLAEEPRLRVHVRRLAASLQLERVVFFRLMGGDFLAAGIESVDLEKKKNRVDSLFVITPDTAPRVTIHAFPGSPLGDRVAYQPLHRLALTIRHWLAGFLRDQRSPWDHSRRPGFEELDAFVDNLTRAYGRNLERLAKQRDTSALPSFYDLTGVEAHLSFSIETTVGRVSFQQLLEPTTDREPADTSATSRIALRCERRAGHPTVTVSLEEIEFLPQAEMRDALIDWLLEHRTEIARQLDRRRPGRYLRYLEDPERRRVAVIFRTYRTRRGEQLLVVVWPGETGQRIRDFVFAVEKRGEEIGEIEDLMGIGDELPDITLDHDQFSALHRFFAAMRLWRNRGAA